MHGHMLFQREASLFRFHLRFLRCVPQWVVFFFVRRTHTFPQDGDRVGNCTVADWYSAPRFLLRDRDRIFSRDFVEQVKAMGIKQVLSAPRSPG